MGAYALSLLVGLGVGVLYGLVNVRSPAPPIVAVLGLVGILAGEHLTQSLKARLAPPPAATILQTGDPS